MGTVGTLILVGFLATWWNVGFGWAALIFVAGPIVLFICLAMASDGDEAETEDLNENRKPKGPSITVNARVRIKYTDANGDESEREIHAYEYTDTSPGYIKARCSKAKANRTFRTDRIKEAIDLETGEVIRRIPTFMRSKRQD